MGKTAFSGPVFGAKSLLATANVDAVSTGAGDGISTAIGACIVPSGEDWLITDFYGARESTGSTNYGLAIDDDGTNVSSITLTSSLAAQRRSIVVTPDAGEFSGKLVASGSTITFRLVVSSGIGASSGVQMSIYGYPRFIPGSTRYAE
jgi:hypothetical protein